MQRDDAVKSALCDAVLEFLSAAVHTVLKARNVYTAELFENRRLYGISVSQCRHPDVCLYVSTVLGNLKVGASVQAAVFMLLRVFFDFYISVLGLLVVLSSLLLASICYSCCCCWY